MVCLEKYCVAVCFSLVLMREPILADNASEHRTFCKYVSDLLERVLGKTIHTMSYFTLSKITKVSIFLIINVMVWNVMCILNVRFRQMLLHKQRSLILLKNLFSSFTNIWKVEVRITKLLF
jgi:hypothetical protein